VDLHLSTDELAGRWLDGAIQEFERVAESRPSDWADLYDQLALLTRSIPAPSTDLDLVCARCLLQAACLRLAGPLRGAYTRVDGSPGVNSIWKALETIDGKAWPDLPGEFRALASSNRPAQSVPGRVAAHLRTNFMRACRLRDVARGAGASIRVMTSAFRREYRCTIHEYVSLLRLRAAIRLLIESDLKIAAISESVGWNSQADFYRHLRRYTPLSPGAARLDRSGISMLINQLDEWLNSHGLTT
jgi:AraC-like DNA-binding protein